MSAKSQPPALVHEPRELAFIAEARRLLAEAKAIDEVKRIADRADALRYCMKKRGDSIAAQNTAGTIKVRADRRVGQLRKEMAKNKGARGSGSNQHEVRCLDNTAPTSADLGLDKNQSADCQALAGISEEKLEEIAEEMTAAGKPVTTDGILKKIKAEAKKAADEAKRQQAADDAARLAAEGDCGVVRHGDFREIAKELADGSVSLIFTDPPYSRDSLPLYADLARVAARVLRPGGSLLCYCGQVLLPSVLTAMAEHLDYYWCAACIHSGSNNMMREYGIKVGWKPIPWFTNGRRPVHEKHGYMDDFVSGGREKSEHPWQQAEDEARHFIERLTRPGELVFDPFGGGGTTAVVALRLGRLALSCDIDATACKAAMRRVGPEIPR